MRNLGEAIRLALHYGKIAFDDAKVPLDRWPTEFKKSERSHTRR